MGLHLTRAGYNGLVAIWLLPLIVMDLFGNTVMQGDASDYFYYKMMIDGVLLAYTLWQIFGRADTASIQQAQRQKAHPDFDVVGFENLGSWEYIVCAVLALYGLVNWWSLHTINRNSGGLVSLLTAVWSIVSIAVALLSMIQFYNLKSGAIVELKRKVIQ